MNSLANGLAGLALILGIAVLLSEKPKRIPWKSVGLGLAIQVALFVLIFGIPALGFRGPFRFLFQFLNLGFTTLLSFSDLASSFLFGDLARPGTSTGFVFRALTPVVFLSSLVSVAHYVGLLEKIVNFAASLLKRSLGASGPEAVNAAGNIFLGQIEAPMLIRPFLSGLTRSEVFCVMTAGMSTVAAGAIAALVGVLGPHVPDIAGHLLTASVMAAPGSIYISKILIPEDAPVDEIREKIPQAQRSPDSNLVSALVRGAQEGLYMSFSICAVLIAFLGVIAALDLGIENLMKILGLFEGQTIGFSEILGWAFSPLAWAMGCPWSEALLVGKLLGQKMFFNEFVAYIEFSQIAESLSNRSLIIASYSLCGFANFASIGIQVAGIGVLAPSQKKTLARLGFKAMIAGTLTTLITGTLAGLLS